MLPKGSRLTAAEVRAILKGGSSLRGPSLSLKYLPSRSSKAAIVVSSKVAKTAVLRNKLRRAGYEALRGRLPKHIRLVLFLHKPLLNTEELITLCSKLS